MRSASGSGRSSSSAIALGETFQTSLNHVMNTSTRAREMRSVGYSGGSGATCSRRSTMAIESATTSPSNSATGTRSCPLSARIAERSAASWSTQVTGTPL